MDGKKSGNIYRLTNARKVASSDLNRLIEHISSNYRTLPFSERWCHRYERKAKAQIRKLQKMGIIHAYPVLKDIESGTVAQSEHTVIVVDGGCETIT